MQVGFFSRLYFQYTTSSSVVGSKVSSGCLNNTTDFEIAHEEI